ncbi:mitochondrial RNA binding protein 2 MRP2 gBP25 [Leptomonas seymouri]|uniref:Mitochondrial RNA binding protein 2 MRP2 gBP25 n=1 Tax=Leptomonas seymouri TaxID=5684 RepID=A0A0N0P2W9_LEPSE|nr:mitochondrial RNA binding protein 2 MRP2 gBP25 [Leptomonas seymouri]|eukprot:KPI83449.1 mitochondrial RNA binding protein 2 MRP2 gBP25 [Leptomonas seymouri]
MLRRVTNACAASSRRSMAAAISAASTSPTTAAPMILSAPQQLQARWVVTDAAGSTNNNRYRSPEFNRQRFRRAILPPAFDVVHWNDEDVSRGHLLRVLHRGGYIVLDYHRQRPVEEPAGDAIERRLKRAEKVVTVTLPPVYVARFLGVLEGRMDSVEVQSRFTNAVFKPNTAKGKHHYVLHCTSMKPTTGQAQTVDGTDVHEETVEWTVELDVAESLMLHRFLTQALHFNSGFSRNA